MKCGGFGFYDSPNEIKLCTAIAFLAFDATNNTEADMMNAQKTDMKNN